MNFEIFILKVLFLSNGSLSVYMVIPYELIKYPACILTLILYVYKPILCSKISLLCTQTH